MHSSFQNVGGWIHHSLNNLLVSLQKCSISTWYSLPDASSNHVMRLVMLQVWRLLFFWGLIMENRNVTVFWLMSHKRVLSLAWVVAFSSILHGLLITYMRCIGLSLLVSPPLRIIESELYLTSELNFAQLHLIRRWAIWWPERGNDWQQLFSRSVPHLGCEPRQQLHSYTSLSIPSLLGKLRSWSHDQVWYLITNKGLLNVWIR